MGTLGPIAWCASLFGRSGYAEEARNAILALDRVGAPVVPVPLYWSSWLTTLAPGVAERLEALVPLRLPERFAYIEHFHPPRYTRHPRATCVIGRPMCETAAVPEGWVPKCNEMDEIWVPSEFNVETFARGGVAREKLHAMPECLDVERYDHAVEPLEIAHARGFVFLSVFAWVRRKGWDVLVRAYLEEFAADEDVTLVLKITPTYDTPLSGDVAELHRLIRELGRDPTRSPRIVVFDVDPGSHGMPRLYRAADAFVLPSRGEGWGRPLMEAMAMGLPTIGTRWSGNLGFMTDANSYLIDYELVDVNEAGRKEGSWWPTSRFARGERWAEPSVMHLRAIMRHVFEDRAEARARGARAREHIREHFSYERVAALMLERLRALNAI